MFLYVSRQSAAEPPEPKSVTRLMQVLRGVCRRHSEKIHSIQRGDNVRPIPTESAVEIDRMIPVVSKDRKDRIDMFLRR